MPKTRAGRPKRDAKALSKAWILSAAMPLMRAHGPDGVSFRRLAEVLEVSPMAVKYHVGSHHDLLAALIERAFAGTLDGVGSQAPASRLREILSAYCRRALDNANLIRCILQDVSLMTVEMVRITEEIRVCTQAMNDGDPGDAMLNLLVDYTHGFVFSVLAAGPDGPLTMKDFLRSVDWVIALCARSPASQSRVNPSD